MALTEQGEAEAAALAVQLAGIQLDVCVHTRFDRTRRTAELALAGRDVPFEVEPLLDDIDVGELEGSTIHDYRDWKHAHTRGRSLPGRREPGRRRAPLCRAFERLLDPPRAARPRRLPRDPRRATA